MLLVYEGIFKRVFDLKGFNIYGTTELNLEGVQCKKEHQLIADVPLYKLTVYFYKPSSSALANTTENTSRALSSCSIVWVAV